MKKSLILIVFTMLLCGCQQHANSEEYDQKVKEGLWKVHNEKFHQAYTAFQLAETKDHKDDCATVYKQQVGYILEAKAAAKEQNETKAYRLLHKAVAVKDGSDLIAERAQELVEEIKAS